MTGRVHSLKELVNTNSLLTACLLHHDMVWKYFILFSPRTLHAINVLALGELNLSSTRFIVIQQRTSSLKSM